MLWLKRRRKAFSLVEVLAAAAIFATVMLLVFGTFQLALRLTRQARETTIAVNLAEQMVDSIRSTQFDSITLNATPSAVATSKLPAGFTKTYVSIYGGNARIKEVRVVVYWQTRPESNPISLTTLVSLGGVGHHQ